MHSLLQPDTIDSLKIMLCFQETSQTQIDKIIPNHKPFTQGQFIIINTFWQTKRLMCHWEDSWWWFYWKNLQAKRVICPPFTCATPPGQTFVQRNPSYYLCISVLNRNCKSWCSIQLHNQLLGFKQWILTLLLPTASQWWMVQKLSQGDQDSPDPSSLSHI